jgi:hypothetical protein
MLMDENLEGIYDEATGKNKDTVVAGAEAIYSKQLIKEVGDSLACSRSMQPDVVPFQACDFMSAHPHPPFYGPGEASAISTGKKLPGHAVMMVLAKLKRFSVLVFERSGPSAMNLIYRDIVPGIAPITLLYSPSGVGHYELVRPAHQSGPGAKPRAAPSATAASSPSGPAKPSSPEVSPAEQNVASSPTAGAATAQSQINNGVPAAAGLAGTNGPIGTPTSAALSGTPLVKPEPSQLSSASMFVVSLLKLTHLCAFNACVFTSSGRFCYSCVHVSVHSEHPGGRTPTYVPSAAECGPAPHYALHATFESVAVRNPHRRGGDFTLATGAQALLNAATAKELNLDANKHLSCVAVGRAGKNYFVILNSEDQSYKGKQSANIRVAINSIESAKPGALMRGENNRAHPKYAAAVSNFDFGKSRDFGPRRTDSAPMSVDSSPVSDTAPRALAELTNTAGWVSTPRPAAKSKRVAWR